MKDKEDNNEAFKAFLAYLKNPEGVLVTDERNYQGAQARNVIAVVQPDNNTDFDNIVLRCTSLLIFVEYNSPWEPFGEGKIFPEKSFVVEEDLFENIPEEDRSDYTF